MFFNLLKYKFWTGHATRPKSGTSTSYENALCMNGISWISASSTKLLGSGV